MSAQELPPLPRFHGKPKSASEILVRARKLLDDPRRWTRLALARDRRGHVLKANDCLGRKAACWCVSGAVWRVAPISPWRAEAWDHLEQTLIRWFDQDAAVSTFNDEPGRKHGEILKLLDAAIDAAKLHEKEGKRERESKLNR